MLLGRRSGEEWGWRLCEDPRSLLPAVRASRMSYFPVTLTATVIEISWVVGQEAKKPHSGPQGCYMYPSCFRWPGREREIRVT